MKALKESRGKSAKGYKIKYDIDSWIQKNWHDHLLAGRSRSKPVKEPWDCTIDYMDWFKKVTHPIVQNPKNSSGSVWSVPGATGTLGDLDKMVQFFS